MRKRTAPAVLLLLLLLRHLHLFTFLPPLFGIEADQLQHSSAKGQIIKGHSALSGRPHAFALPLSSPPREATTFSSPLHAQAAMTFLQVPHSSASSRRARPDTYLPPINHIHQCHHNYGHDYEKGDGNDYEDRNGNGMAIAIAMARQVVYSFVTYYMTCATSSYLTDPRKDRQQEQPARPTNSK